jgi:hypothetical protein
MSASDGILEREETFAAFVRKEAGAASVPRKEAPNKDANDNPDRKGASVVTAGTQESSFAHSAHLVVLLIAQIVS